MLFLETFDVDAIDGAVIVDMRDMGRPPMGALCGRWRDCGLLDPWLEFVYRLHAVCGRAPKRLGRRCSNELFLCTCAGRRARRRVEWSYDIMRYHARKNKPARIARSRAPCMRTQERGPTLVTRTSPCES